MPEISSLNQAIAFAGALISAPVLVCAAEISVADLDALPAADVVLLGEVHDNPAHHAAQARALAALAPRAVVFEMLTPEQAERVTPMALADLDTLGDVLEWEASGWPDFEIYKPVFAALGPAPVLGAAQERATVRAAFSKGAAEVFGDDASRFGLTAALEPAQQTRRETEQFEAHCDAMPMDMMAGMVEAQRFRDAAFARVILNAVELYGSPVVGIMGSGHARTDWGVPAAIGVASPETSVVSVGLLEGLVEGETPPFDLWLVTAPAEREDPCAAFR